MAFTMELKKFLTIKKYNNKLASAMVLIFLKENIMLIVKNVWNKKQNGSKIFNKLKIRTAIKANRNYKQLLKDISFKKLNLINEVIKEVFGTRRITIAFGVGTRGTIDNSRFKKILLGYEFVIPMFYLETDGNDVQTNDIYIPFQQELILPKLSIFFRKHKKFPCREQLITYFERVYNNYKNMLIDDELNLSNQTFMKSPSDDFDLSTMGKEIKK